MGKLSKIQPGETVEARWLAVQKYATAAAQFERAKLACQVMAGFELIELHKVHDIKPGRTKELVNGSPINSQASKWEDLVKDHAGVSRWTAANWMEMAKAVRPRLRKLDSAGRLAELMELSPSQWTEDDTQMISQVVHKITDGRSQAEFMVEIGVGKSDKRGSGGVREGAGRPNLKAMTGEERLSYERERSREDWAYVLKALTPYRSGFMVLEDEEIDDQIFELQMQIKARRAWLRQPKGQRNPADVEKEFQS